MREVFLRFLGLARPHWKSLTVGLILVLLAAAIGLVVPLGIRELLDTGLYADMRSVRYGEAPSPASRTKA